MVNKWSKKTLTLADSQVETKATVLQKCVTTSAQLLSKYGTRPANCGKK